MVTEGRYPVRQFSQFSLTGPYFEGHRPLPAAPPPPPPPPPKKKKKKKFYIWSMHSLQK